MNEGLEKVLLVLKEHKGKTISGMALLGLASVFKYAKTSGRMEKILAKVVSKLQKKIEEKAKEKEKLAKMNYSFEELYIHFLSLSKGIKRNLKRDIDSIFDIEGIKQSLKSKTTSPEERNSLMLEFKTEIFLYAIFSIIYLPVSKVILFIRECILHKYERFLEGESEKNLQVLESFFSDFSEFIIRNAGKFLYTYLKERLNPIISKLQINQSCGESEIIQILNQMCDVITEIDENDPKDDLINNEETPFLINLSFDEVVGDTTFIDVNGIANLLREEKEGERKRASVQNHLHKDTKEVSFKFPQFRIRAFKAFTKATEGQRIVENMDYFLRYFYISSTERSSGLTGIAEVEEEEEKYDFGEIKPPSQAVKKNGIVMINLEEDEEIKQEENLQAHNDIEIPQQVNQVREDNHHRVLKVMKMASDEFLDLIECGNFNLYGLYAINFEMKKLINRVMMYFERKNNHGDRFLLVSFLPTLYKIINEEFIDEMAEEINERFYTSQIKVALSLMTNNHSKAEDVYINCQLMEEFEMKRHIENGLKEFGKRIFMDKEYYSASQPRSNESILEQFLKEIE